MTAVTFKALNTGHPLNISCQTGPWEVLQVHFDREGYFTTDEASLIDYLKTHCATLCKEVKFEDKEVVMRVEVSEESEVLVAAPVVSTVAQARNIGLKSPKA